MVPNNITVHNLLVPKAIENTKSLIKQLRAKLSLIEPLLQPFLRVDPGIDNEPSKEQVLLFHNYKVHSQIIVDHIRAKVRQGPKQLKAVFLNAE